MNTRLFSGPDAGRSHLRCLMAARKTVLASVEYITQAILVLRGQRVILDSDLAAIYGVTTGRLNEAVKRNAGRFPEDFMFRLSVPEHAALISQIAISNPGRGGRLDPGSTHRTSRSGKSTLP